jgi:hypothetical protein
MASLQHAVYVDCNKYLKGVLCGIDISVCALQEVHGSDPGTQSPPDSDDPDLDPTAVDIDIDESQDVVGSDLVVDSESGIGDSNPVESGDDCFELDTAT